MFQTLLITVPGSKIPGGAGSGTLTESRVGNTQITQTKIEHPAALEYSVALVKILLCCFDSLAF